ncbi:DegT/DnrJ/EryC1/StrS family aminotransferase, partial [Marinobacter nauticus]
MILINQPSREFDACQQQIEREVLSVLRSGRYIFGPQTELFTAELAAHTGVAHAIPVANGTDALGLALRGVGVDRGDEVITAANAGFYTSAMLVEIGAIPVYADVEAPGMGLDMTSVEQMVSDRTKAIVVTHLYGNLVDVPKLKAHLADALGRDDIAIIEDCAQAHGAMLDNGRKAGSLGDVATFSFYPTKNLAALGDAGAVVTNSDDIAKRVRMLQQYGWADRYDVHIPHGRNSRM